MVPGTAGDAVMKRQPAFTLVECIAALLVTSLVVVLTGYALTAVRTTSRLSLAQATDWVICLQELESADHHFALKWADRYQLELRDLNQHRNYELCLRDRLYLRSVNGGYMPVFSNIRVEQSGFKRLDSQRVYITVTRTNGQKLEGIVCFEKDQ